MFGLIWILIIFNSNLLFSQIVTPEMSREYVMMKALQDPSLAPLTYIFGPGDVIKLDIWGNTNVTYGLCVSQDGTIFIPRFEGVKPITSLSGYTGVSLSEPVPALGEIKAEGLTAGELKEEIEKRIRKYFHGVNVRVSLTGLRQFPTSIHGGVKYPDIYQITPLYRLSNLIEIAGGISGTGSYRNITIKSTDGSSQLYDLYEFFYKGEMGQNPYLKEGDIVIVAQAVMSVKIRGEILKEGNYELKVGERLKDIIEIAGGFKKRGSLSKTIRIHNVRNPDEVKEIDPYKLFVENDSLSNVEIETGDLIIVSPEPFTVTITGEVNLGGVFEYEHGLTDFYYYLGLAGGYSEWANPKNVGIIRHDGTTLKWKKGVEIKTGDRIIVGRAQIRDWRDLLEVSVNVANVLFMIWAISK